MEADTQILYVLMYACAHINIFKFPSHIYIYT